MSTEVIVGVIFLMGFSIWVLIYAVGSPNVSSETYKKCIDTFTFIALLVGLGFAWDQAEKLTEAIKSNKTSIAVSNYASLSALTSEIDKVMVNEPDLYGYFYESKDLKKEEITGTDEEKVKRVREFNKLSSINIMILDWLDTVASEMTYLHDEVPNNVMDEVGWKQYSSDLFEHSPTLCRKFKDNQKFYGKAIKNLVPNSCQ